MFFPHRMKNEHNKMPTEPKPSKPVVPPHLSKPKNENKDPGISEVGKKPPVRPGGSKLPVLAKSVSLQPSSDFSQSHCRWEEKPLAVSASFLLCRFKCLIRWLFYSLFFILTFICYRGRLGRKINAPGRCHLTFLSPGVQEWPVKISSL